MPYPTLEQLVIFAKLVQTGSVTRAAEETGITQPAVTQHLRALERRLGVALTRRAGRLVRLTDAGQAVAGYARELVALADRMRDAVGAVQGIGGRLIIGASTTVGECVLPREIARFCEAHPGVEVRLQILHGHEVVERLLTYEFDLGFMGSRPRNASVIARPFRRDEIVLAVAPSHPLASKRAPSPALLGDQAWLLRERGALSRTLALAALRRLRVLPRTILEFGSNAALRTAALSGMGAAAVSRHVVGDDLAAGRLHLLRLPGWSCERPFYMLRRKHQAPETAEQAFMDFLYAGPRRGAPAGARVHEPATTA